jgi:DNA polymerase III subunit epsilon
MASINQSSLFVYDLETTGPDPASDYIISMSYVIVRPGQPAADPVYFLVNPGVPIPEGSTAVHGITDADVADKPGFDVYAESIASILKEPGLILSGYNNRKFDDVVLERELREAGFPVDLFAMPCLDLFALWRIGEPRTLGGAMRRFLGQELDGAHNAENDALAVVNLIPAMSAFFEGTLPASATELNGILFPEQSNWVDRMGKIIKNDQGEPSLAFGKHKGVALRTMDKGYLQWMLGQDFPEDTKAIISSYL